MPEVEFIRCSNFKRQDGQHRGLESHWGCWLQNSWGESRPGQWDNIGAGLARIIPWGALPHSTLYYKATASLHLQAQSSRPSEFSQTSFGQPRRQLYRELRKLPDDTCLSGVWLLFLKAPLPPGEASGQVRATWRVHRIMPGVLPCMYSLHTYFGLVSKKEDLGQDASELHRSCLGSSDLELEICSTRDIFLAFFATQGSELHCAVCHARPLNSTARFRYIDGT